MLNFSGLSGRIGIGTAIRFAISFLSLLFHCPLDAVAVEIVFEALVLFDTYIYGTPQNRP
jgi:hypothetical protein